jgi:mannose-6-phosphate isomerase-like protein (cupin superfamily)
MSTATTDIAGVRRMPADHLATARRYAANPDDWPMAPRFNPVQRWYRRLAAGPDAEVWLLTWLPGQGTGLHDHGGCVGAFLVVSGTLTEHTVATGTAGVPRLVDGNLGPGEGRSFGPRHIHQITNTGVQPAVSLHVYGPALREMTRYRLQDGRLVVTAVDRAGADW